MNTRSAENGLVSVIVPTRNSDATLARCLESVRRQTYGYLELIVVDNDSRDGTLETAKALADRAIGGGKERSAQRNIGARIAEGTHLLFVDSDMVLDSTVVAECLKVAVTGADAIVIPETSFGTGFWARCKALERSCYVGDETIEAARFFSRELFFSVGGYDEAMTAAEDWDLHLRALATGARIGRTTSWIHHDEGRLKLRRLVRKKFSYGRALHRYLQKNPERARGQFTPVRAAFLRHKRRLLSHPATLAGLVVMKSCEFAAGGLGLLSAERPRRRAK